MQANGLKTLHKLESYFFDRVRKIVVGHGKTVIGWEEVARTSIPDDSSSRLGAGRAPSPEQRPKVTG
jgi:N-acetyl-beta-hexosaminidase